MNFGFGIADFRFLKTLCALWSGLCVLVALLAPAWKISAEEASSELVAKVQEQYDQTRSLRAKFVQKTYSRAASLEASARGTLYFLKPRAMRWDYEEPRQRFVITDDKAWLYVPEEKTVYLYEVGHVLRSPLVLSFFSGLGRLRESFLITQLPKDAGPPPRFRLELIPNESESAVSRITLWVDVESYRVVRIQTEDPLGNINEISLTSIEVDTPLKPSWFALKVPEGVRLERQDASVQ